MTFLRAVLGLVFGDVYGLQYECLWPKPQMQWIDPSSLGFGCVDECGGRCCYSDDTEMLLAAAKCVSSLGSVEDFAKCLAQSLDVSNRVRYYSTAMKRVVSYIRSGYPWLDAVHSAMDLCREDPSPVPRALIAVALCSDIECVEKVASTQAVATHACREAVERSKAFALAAYLIVREGLSHRAAIEELPTVSRWHEPLASTLKLVPEVFSDPPFAVVKTLRSYGCTALELGLVAAYGASSVLDALARAISLGGDVDTSAAIACSLLAASKRSPPLDLLSRVEGLESVVSLALRLSLRR